jgi:TPR repeat protein
VSWAQRLHRGWRAALGRPAARLSYAVALAADGEHHRAFSHFARAAGSGLPEAQCRLGRCYLLGLGVPSCLDAALHWLTRAATAGQADAQALLASLALQGISHGPEAGLFDAASRYTGQPPDYHQALKWGEQAAAQGSAEAQALLGYILTSGPDEMRDLPRAARYYQLSAESGFAQGQLGWALTLLRDNAAHGGSAQVRRLLRLAADAGLPAAHFALGALVDQPDSDQAAGHQTGSHQTDGDQADGAPDQPAVAAAHYRAGAELGHRSAQLRYGMALLHGHGIARDAHNGETWLRRAGLAGDPLAAALVGDLYTRQDGPPPNFCEAAIWFQRAAEAGHIGAARALGQLSLRGGGFGTDPVTAAHWLRVAATAGDAVAAYELAICLAHGIGTARDDAEALQWFHYAIDAMPAARFWYGRMLAEGRGAATDLPAARACFLRASADGNGDATVAAAEMLVNGRGGPPDQPTAMRMFGHAAAQGHRGAQFALEVLQPPSGISPTGICPPGVSPPAIPPPGVSPPDIPLPAMATSGGECVAA